MLAAARLGFGFAPDQRLLTERDFKRVLMARKSAGGGKRVSAHFVMQWLARVVDAPLSPDSPDSPDSLALSDSPTLPTSACARLGMVVGKRLARTSVERNRVRRQIREAFRLHRCAHLGVDVVVRLNRARGCPLPALRAEVDALFDTLLATTP